MEFIIHLLSIHKQREVRLRLNKNDSGNRVLKKKIYFYQQVVTSTQGNV